MNFITIILPEIQQLGSVNHTKLHGLQLYGRNYTPNDNRLCNNLEYTTSMYVLKSREKLDRQTQDKSYPVLNLLDYVKLQPTIIGFPFGPFNDWCCISTGIDSPYVRPENAEIVVSTADQSAEKAAEAIVAKLEEFGVLGAWYPDI